MDWNRQAMTHDKSRTSGSWVMLDTMLRIQP
jgi:hypothetical protein